jgi:hypothetical protein
MPGRREEKKREEPLRERKLNPRRNSQKQRIPRGRGEVFPPLP